MDKFWAGGFLYNPGNSSVLLHKRDSETKYNPDSWAFFGGLNEKGENPVDCLIRELEEEIGIKLQKKEIIQLYDYFNKEFQTHRFVFYAESGKDEAEFDLTEGADLAWVKLDKTSNYNLTEKTAKDLSYFVKNRVSYGLQ